MKFDKYTCLGFYFLFIQAIIVYNTPDLTSSIYIWFCNHTPILFAIGFFTRRIEIVKSLICIGLIPHFFWMYDLFVYFLFGFHPFGYTKDAIARGTISLILAIIVHMFSTTVALLGTYKEPVKMKQTLL